MVNVEGIAAGSAEKRAAHRLGGCQAADEDRMRHDNPQVYLPANGRWSLVYHASTPPAYGEPWKTPCVLVRRGGTSFPTMIQLAPKYPDFTASGLVIRQFVFVLDVIVAPYTAVTAVTAAQGGRLASRCINVIHKHETMRILRVQKYDTPAVQPFHNCTACTHTGN